MVNVLYLFFSKMIEFDKRWNWLKQFEARFCKASTYNQAQANPRFNNYDVSHLGIGSVILRMISSAETSDPYISTHRTSEACYNNISAQEANLFCGTASLTIQLTSVEVGYSHNNGCLDEPEFCSYHEIATSNSYYQYLVESCEGRQHCLLDSVYLWYRSDERPFIFNACGHKSTQWIRNKVKVHYLCTALSTSKYPFWKSSF